MSSKTEQSNQRQGGGDAVQPGDFLGALGLPAASFRAVGQVQRMQMLGSLLLALIVAGWLSGLVQLATVPRFLPTFVAMSAGLTLLTVAYLMSRRCSYRLAAVITCAAPVAACLAVLANNPDDRAAPFFAILGVLFATTFLSTQAALLVALAVLGAIGLEMTLVPALRAPERIWPVIAFHVIVPTLLLIAASHRNRVEAAQRAALCAAGAKLAEADGARVRLEARLQAAGPLVTVGRISAGLAHDLNNVLGLVLNGFHGLETADGRVGAAARQVEAAGRHATGLLRQMLALGRDERGAEPPVLDLSAALRKTEPLLTCALGAGCELVIRRCTEGTSIRVDALDLQRMLLNLALNARAAMENGGTLVLETLAPRFLPANLRLELPARRYVTLLVTDSGRGIAEDLGSRALRPFVTSRAEQGGLGLGLSIVEEIARRYAGAVELHSQPGHGTRVEILLPALG